MIRMSLLNAAEILAMPAVADVQFAGVSTDSRKIRPGMLFVALAGDRADGHAYADQAVKAGAAAILASRECTDDVPQLIVDDVVAALGKLAGHWRRALDPVVVGITGSNGKTTTKEMVSSILGMRASVLATAGNFNNELGLPLTLFGLEEEHEFAILEMGASKAGDIRYLAEIAKPDVGVVTNVGPAHLQGFGDEEGVARAKGEIYSSLPAEGFAVINADQTWAEMWRDLGKHAQLLEFGTGTGSDVYVSSGTGQPVIHTPKGSFGLRLRLPGAHNIENALAATSICLALGIDVEQIQAGLEATKPVPGRLNIVHVEAGWTVIDDTYNANPASLYAALQVLSAEQGTAWLVLGDMKELGPASRKLHVEMGSAARALGVRRLFAVGEVTTATVDAFGDGAEHFPDHESLIEALQAALKPGVACLVKGSRSMGMERVVKSITQADRLRETG